MNVIASRGAVPRKSNDRRQKILLGVLLVVLAGVLAFQLPKLLGGSEGTTSSAPAPVATDATAAEATAPAAAGAESTAPPAAGAQATATATTDPTGRDRRAARLIASWPVRDPFAPRLGPESVAPTPAATPAPPPKQAPAPPVTGTPVAAVVFVVGQRQVIAVGRPFSVGDMTFRLVKATRTQLRIVPVVGKVAGSKGAVTLERGRTVTLENAATGVRYQVRFAQALAPAPPAG